MKNEFNAHKALKIEAEIKAVKDQIRNYVGIVPAELYDRLDALEAAK